MNREKALQIKKLRQEGIIPINVSELRVYGKQRKKRKPNLKRRPSPPEPKPYTIIKKREDGYKEVVFDRATVKRIWSSAVEELILTYLKTNHKKLAKDAFPVRSEFNGISILYTDPLSQEPVGTTRPKSARRKYLCKWHGDLVFIFNDKEYGKRAIIFEVKSIKITTCASCGALITTKSPKVKNPLRYKKGKNKGKEKPCCKHPDWRRCTYEDCEADGAIVCINCGMYYGAITW